MTQLSFPRTCRAFQSRVVALLFSPGFLLFPVFPWYIVCKFIRWSKSPTSSPRCVAFKPKRCRWLGKHPCPKLIRLRILWVVFPYMWFIMHPTESLIIVNTNFKSDYVNNTYQWKSPFTVTSKLYRHFVLTGCFELGIMMMHDTVLFPDFI